MTVAVCVNVGKAVTEGVCVDAGGTEVSVGTSVSSGTDVEGVSMVSVGSTNGVAVGVGVCGSDVSVGMAVKVSV